MKDPISKYIKENKDKLDTHVPGTNNWDAIEQRIQGKKKNRKLYWFISSAAAILLLFVVFRGNDVISPKSTGEKKNILAAEEGAQRSEVAWTSNRDANYQYSQRNKENSDNSITGLNSNLTYVNLTVSDGLATNYNSGTSSDNIYGWTSDVQGCVSSVPSNNGYSFNKISPLANLPFQNAPPKSVKRTNRAMEAPPAPKLEVNHYYEHYDKFKENAFESPLNKPLSTFGVDVDGAGYSNVRRFVSSGFIPPKDAVKLEEMINYFNYDLPEPTGEHPFSITTEVGECPWESDHLLMQIAIKGKSIDFKESKANNLVFLIDVSGSMNSADKLPLLKKSLSLAVKEMGSKDKVAIVVYAGAAGLVLPSTSCKYKEKIYEAIENLSAGGSTAGGEGIELAYKVAKEEFLKSGNNRILLATDGDFNVGMSDDESLINLIEKKRNTGIYLSVLGFGTGNLQSSKIEKIADNGNGNYYYIDNLMEAKKVLVNEIGGTLVTIAKDVKLQLEFNQDYVKSYRLLGYENRILETRDFDDDTKDAGDLGSGHTIVAMYELVKQDKVKEEAVGSLRYQKQQINNSKGMKDELAFVKFRYKKPNSNKSKLIKKVISNSPKAKNSENFLFASAVAEYGMLLRESKHRGDASFHQVIVRAQKNIGNDKFGYRNEFVVLVQKSMGLMWEYYMSESFKGR